MNILHLNREKIIPKDVKKEYDFSVLVVPCVHRGVDPDTWESLIPLLFCQNPRIVVKFRSGDALIDRSRSIVASRFLESDFDVLLFIDDDIIFDPKKIGAMLQVMWKEKLDICGAPYVKKQPEKTHFAIKLLDEAPVIPFGEEMGAICEVRMISTGCMAIQRWVLQAMVDKEVVHKCHIHDANFYPFFKPEEAQLENGNWIYLSEDWAFTERARRLGFKVWCDTSQKLGHAGRYVYTWDDMKMKKRHHLDNGKYWELDGTMPDFKEIEDPKEQISGVAINQPEAVIAATK